MFLGIEMVAQQALEQRSNNCCELCTASTDLSVFPVPPTSDLSAQQSILVCNTCLVQIEGNTEVKKIKCFTTRPDTLFGFSFLAVSVDHSISKFYEKDEKFLMFNVISN